MLILATSAAGLVAYLYFLGGVVAWLRLATARLSADGGIVSTGSTRLLAIGIRVAALELILLLAISAAVSAFVGFAVLRRGELPRRALTEIDDIAAGLSDLWTLCGMIVPTVALVAIVVGVSVEPLELRVTLIVLGVALGLLVGLLMVFGAPPEGRRFWSADSRKDWSPRWRCLLHYFGRLIRGEEPRRMERWWGWKAEEDAEKRKANGIRTVQVIAALLLVASVFIAVYLVPVLQGTVLLVGVAMLYVGPFVTWPRSSKLQDLGRELVRSSGVWLGIAAATLVALAVVATPPVEYPRATVLIDGQVIANSGAYLDRTGEGVYLGLCTAKPAKARDGKRSRSTAPKIEFIAEDRLRELVIGGPRYEFDPGGRPSLVQVVLSALGGSGTAWESAPLRHTLRARSDSVCGG